MEKIIEAFNDAIFAFKSFPSAKSQSDDSSDQNTSEFFTDINQMNVPAFSSTEILSICRTVKPIFESEQVLINLEGEFIVIGDLHGHLPDLYRIFCLYGLPPNTKYLFLGDLIDRGDFSLPLINLLFALKCVYPQHIYILRGNHEFASICSESGFKHEIELAFGCKAELTATCSNPQIPMEKTKSQNMEVSQDEFPNQSHLSNISISSNLSMNSIPPLSPKTRKTKKQKRHEEALHELVNSIFDEFTNVFSCLPLVAILNGEIICLHGGIGPKFQKLSHIDNVVKPIREFYGGIVDEILWSDPNEDIDLFAPSTRNIGCLYGQDAIRAFLTNNKLRLLVRGHEPIQSGCEYLLGGKVLTIFSASNYCNYLHNFSSILFVHPNEKERVVRLPPFDRFMTRSDATYLFSESRIQEKEKNLALRSRRQSHSEENEETAWVPPIEKVKHTSHSFTEEYIPVGVHFSQDDIQPDFDNETIDDNDETLEIDIDEDRLDEKPIDKDSNLKLKKRDRSMSHTGISVSPKLKRASSGSHSGKKKMRRISETSNSTQPGIVSIVPPRRTLIGSLSV